MFQSITSSGPWPWLIAGMVLIAVELFAPGLFLIWLGLAALATGLLVGLLGLGWTTATVLFATLSVVAVLAGRWGLQRRAQTGDPAAHLNTMARNLIGKSFSLDHAIHNGEGRIRVGDTVWRVVGDDLPVGSRVVVVGVDGSALAVKAA